MAGRMSGDGERGGQARAARRGEHAMSRRGAIRRRGFNTSLKRCDQWC